MDEDSTRSKWTRLALSMVILFCINLIACTIGAFLCSVIAGVNDPPYAVKFSTTALIALGMLYRFHFWPVKELYKAVKDIMR